jgi:Carboxypeptidase regulatory-like domain
MRSIVSAVVALVILFGAQPLFTFAQDQKETGTIKGSVTLDGKPAKDITVVATPSITDASKIVESVVNKPATLKATTDSEGHYTFEGLGPGTYRLTPFAPTMVSTSPQSERDVSVAAGDTSGGVDFSLSQGGVITGRLTDSDGRPVILETITLKPVEASPSSASSATATAIMLNAFGGTGRMYTTDDRGIYRIYGLRPGRYLVSAGSASDVLSSMFRLRPKRTKTFYPGVTEESKAKQVQVNAGAKGFVASGRVVEAEKGTPISKALVAYSPARSAPNKPDTVDSDDDADERVAGLDGGLPGAMTTTNDKGEFRFESVPPGKYVIEVSQLGALTGTGTSEFYGDPINFEVRSGNVDRIEVKMHRGASISGVAVVESADKEQDVQSFGRVMIMAAVTDEATKAFSQGTASINADGTFQIGGLKAGKATIRVLSMGTPKASLLRIERNGAEVQGGFDIQPNEQVSGVRLVLSAANCVIKGHVTIEGGSLPSGAPLVVRTHRLQGDPNFFFDSPTGQVDSNGNFEIEDLAPGAYDVEVSVMQPGSNATSAKQSVTVSNDAPAYVSLTLNVKGKAKDR